MMTTLKHSAADWAFLGAVDPREYYAQLKAIGYSAVEMAEPENWPLARAAGLEVLNICAPGMREGLNKTDNHLDLIPYVMESVTTASENGIPYVVIFSGNREDGLSDEQGLANCITGARQLVRHVAKHDVTLLFEMLSTDHEGYMADNAQFGFDLVRAVDSPNLKIVYDIYHMGKMGEDVVADITANLDIVEHLHIAGPPKRNFPGADQDIDYATIVPAVCRAGYDKYWGQEFCPATQALTELNAALRLFESHATA